jgi:tetratricopeptide (TPR) repeat protein
VRDALAERGPSPLLVRALIGRAHSLAHLRRYEEAAKDAEDAMAMATELSWPEGKAISLICLTVLAHYSADNQQSMTCMRQAMRIDQGGLPDDVARDVRFFLARALREAGELAEARKIGESVLAWAWEADALLMVAECLPGLAELDLLDGDPAQASRRVRQALDIAWRMGNRYRAL